MGAAFIAGTTKPLHRRLPLWKGDHTGPLFPEFAIHREFDGQTSLPGTCMRPQSSCSPPAHGKHSPVLNPEPRRDLGSPSTNSSSS